MSKVEWSARIYLQSADDIAKLRDVGLEPVRALTNEGQVPIMRSIDGEVVGRIALVDCQTKYKRGEGWKAKCTERDATAFVIAAALDMLAALKGIVAESELQDQEADKGLAEFNVARLEAALGECRAAISKATMTAP